MHVGHLRSTIIGDCIARILEYLDYQVVRVNHIGDWGTQFGMLIAYLKLNNKLSNNNNITDGLNLANLIKYYQSAKQLFDQDQEFKKTAQTEVVALQRHDTESIAIWQKICNISAENYRKIYRLLDINITDKGESFYHEMLPKIINDFSSQGLITESDGAKCVYLPGFVGRDNNPLPLMIQKSDGGYNYATTDLAAVKYRIQEEQADWLIYVTDSGQSLHFKMLLAAATQVGYLNEQKTKFSHVPFGLVLRSDGKKFKTREGDTEKLIDLINNAINTAKNILLAREEQFTNQELNSLANKLGINAIKYADLANNRNSNYVFDYDKMLQFNGNTAAFLSYAYVRINSIKHKIGVVVNNLINSLEFKITNQHERNLALRICKFQEVLLATAEELLPNRLTDYLYLLAEEFHAFFHHCKVAGSESQNNRLLLCEATANIIKLGFSLLGLQIIDKM
jgi:arginyl-tRNA synthetase